MRLLRLGNLIRNEVADVLRKKLDDHRIGFVSITGVELSPDMKYAKIYYSQFGSEAEKKKTSKALFRATGFIKYEVGKVINLKIMPEFEFKYDDSLEKGSSLVDKIYEIEKSEADE
ncbi:MAG: 30S ribosome-binding factor RbfA [Candidatus Margulisiibacteriota bacterium]|jgi:ribosome-binding factor A